MDWECTLNGLGIEDAYSRFLCVYNNLWKEYVLIKGNAISKKRGEWISKETLNMNLTKSFKVEKIEWERELASRAKHNPKLIYSYIRSKMDVEEQIKALKDDEDWLTVAKSEIADMLNNHFDSMFIKESQNPLPEFEKKTNVKFGTERVLVKINEFEIGKSLKNLTESKS